MVLTSEGGRHQLSYECKVTEYRLARGRSVFYHYEGGEGKQTGRVRVCALSVSTSLCSAMPTYVTLVHAGNGALSKHVPKTTQSAKCILLWAWGGGDIPEVQKREGQCLLHFQTRV